MMKSLDVWYRGGLRFSCTQCGNCCSGAPGYVWVRKQDIENIATFLGHPDGKLSRTYVRRVGIRHSLTERPNGDCIFLDRADGKATCSIYPVRPTQCRTWRFWNVNLKSPDHWNAEAVTCPGMNCGDRYDFEAVETRRQQQNF